MAIQFMEIRDRPWPEKDGMGALMLTPAETAVELRISRSKMYGLLREGSLPFIRIGSSIRIPRAALQQWLDQQVAENAKLLRK